MPLYEYKCRSCGKTFELIQKFADEPLKTHPECGGIVEKLFSAPAFHLKGTGWYATDYGKGNGKPVKQEESKPESKSEKSEKAEKAEKTESKSNTEAATSAGESKSESKSDSSSEPKSKPSPVT